jgi:hypothetical protein
VPSPSYPFDTASKGGSAGNSRLCTGGRATDAARVARFRKILAAPAIDIGMCLNLHMYLGKLFTAGVTQ